MENAGDFDWSMSVEDLPADSLNRSLHAKFLTTFLIDKAKQGSYVININSPWGTGKTWFLRRWEHSLKLKYPTVYVDCWRNDHSNDPFLTVIAEIQNCLISKTEVKIVDNKNFKGAWKLLKDIAPIATKTILKNKLGIEWAAISDIENLDEVGEKIIESAIKNHEESTKSIDGLKKSISEWLDAVTTGNENFQNPLFVFIDELDRCRPTYAIEMLETVKHIFDIKNVIFIIATDKEQLQHSIKAVYGAGFNSSKYLDRFFNRSITLSHGLLDSFITQRVTGNSAPFIFSDNGKTPFEITKDNDTQLSIKIFSTIANFYQMDLRSTNLWLDRIEATLTYSTKPFDLYLLSLLIATEMFENELYTSLTSHGGYTGKNWDSLITKYRMPDYFPKLKIDIHALPAFKGKVESAIFDNTPSIKAHPFMYLTIMFQLMAKKVNKTDMDTRYFDLCERLRDFKNNNTRVLEYAGTPFQLFDGRSVNLDIRNEICILQFNAAHNLSISDYIQYCDLATVLE